MLIVNKHIYNAEISFFNLPMSSDVAETTSLLTNSPIENADVSTSAVTRWHC